MNIKPLGEVVRQRRKALGLSLEIVCGGLCSSMTLSRFEKGQQTPSRDCVVTILQRLGLPENQYYAQLTREETELIRLRKEARAYYNQYEQTLGEERQQACEKALETLDVLERCLKEDDHINQQFILGMRTALEAHSPQKQLELLMEAIRLTSPRFDPENLSKCLFCIEEVSIINKIALSYVHCGQFEKAIDILSQMLKLISKQTPDHKYLPLLAYNCARRLSVECRWEEALEISEVGRQACIRQEHYHLLPRFLHMEAECHYFRGEMDMSEQLYRSAYHIYGAIMNLRNQEILKTDVEERFHLLF